MQIECESFFRRRQSGELAFSATMFKDCVAHSRKAVSAFYSHIREQNMDNKAELFQKLEESLLVYDAEAAVKVAQAIVDAGLDIQGAINVATAVINRIGEQFQNGDIYLP